MTLTRYIVRALWSPEIRAFSIYLGLALSVISALMAALSWSRLHLAVPTMISGYTLFVVIILLGVFNIRKRLAALPLFSASRWAQLHVVGGLLALSLYGLHTHALRPKGAYEQSLTGLFYLVIGSGIGGYSLQRIYPSRLTQSDAEIIFERIPIELVELREEAQDLIFECIEQSKSTTLARYYAESLDWFFCKPHFVFNHLLGGLASQHWIQQHFDTVARYLNSQEKDYLERLKQLAEHKDRVDLHYAVQGLLKVWLLVHVPAAVALVTLALWHLLLVNIYCL